MSELTIEYNLPGSAVHFSESVTETTDGVLKEPTTQCTSVAALEVSGDRATVTLKLKDGWLRDPGAREISRLKQQIDQLKNQKDISVSTRELQAEHELYTVRLDWSRMRCVAL